MLSAFNPKEEKWDEGLSLKKISVPLGVLGVIFESPPDAAAQILSLVLKSGNAAVLKGGKEAKHSNRALSEILLKLNEVPPFLPKEWAVFLETRQDVDEMLRQDKYIDMVIPRGSQELVAKVLNSTKIPVLGHADGICHIYVDEKVSLEKSIPVILDAKTQYPSTCNAVETVLVDEKIAGTFLKEFVSSVDSANVFVNASTRFADGFRAEIGISTSKTHARGPVGLEGLVIYKYIVEGDGQMVKDYSGKGAKHFLHKDL